MSNITTPQTAKAIAIGVDSTRKPNRWPIEESLEELAQLADTAGVEVVLKVSQARPGPHPKSYLGSGKLEELLEQIQDTCAEIVIADDELSPNQHKHLEQTLKVKILDRTSLILDIFAQRAQTAEAQLQVELAQLTYLRPRLTRMWTHLSRLGGGVGTRGPGETQIESDRRQIDKRISLIQTKIKKVSLQRQIKRERRQNVPVISGAIIGYTNAGKSTLLNTLTQSEVLAEDKLFATLDPTTRHIKLPNNDHIVITDTVGFIQKLPHQLVKAFHATLEEVIDANFILHVIDITHPQFREMLATTNKLLKQLQAQDIPRLYVFNKIDALKYPENTLASVKDLQPQVCISAQKKLHIDTLLDTIGNFLDQHKKTITVQLPYNRMDIVSELKEFGSVLEEEYADKIHLTVKIHHILAEKIMAKLQ